MASAGGSDFVHLHVHTEYSMLDGAARLDDLFTEVERLGQTAIATTDHGYLFGAFDFWSKATAARDQADHRRRGVRHAGHQPVRPDPGAVRAAGPGVRRRLGARRVHAHDAAGAEQRGPAQPLPRRRRWPRSRARWASGRAWTATCCSAYSDGPHRDHRLPVGRDADPPAAGPVGRGRARRRRAAGPVRQGVLLRRADGPRARHRDAGHQGPAAAGRDDRRPARRDERPALRQAGGQRRARGAAVRSTRARPWPTRTGSSSTATGST